MNYSAFEEAITEATAGLEELEAEFEKLRVRREQLRSLIRSLLTMLPMEAEAAKVAMAAINASEAEVEQQSDADTTKPTWMLVRDVLAKSKGPLSVPQIHSILLATEKNVPAQDAIRVAMLRKPDIFIKRFRLYALTPSQFLAGPGLPDAKPQAEEDETLIDET